MTSQRVTPLIHDLAMVRLAKGVTPESLKAWVTTLLSTSTQIDAATPQATQSEGRLKVPMCDFSEYQSQLEDLVNEFANVFSEKCFDVGPGLGQGRAHLSHRGHSGQHQELPNALEVERCDG